LIIGSLIRKSRQVLDDPVLRTWLLRRLARLEKSPPEFSPGRPQYLDHCGAEKQELTVPIWPETDQASGFDTPMVPIRITLPSETAELAPGNGADLFTRDYEDLETQLAVHRFAWVPLAGPDVNPDWVAALWEDWVARFADRKTGWPWHAYTAAERAINIIDFGRRFGLPGDRSGMAELLIDHGDIIRDNLEYYGEHYTSNHLSNNGRGLLRIGTAFGHAGHVETGIRILIAEASRIFGRSGVLREGSTHYHLLLTRNYIDAWLDADAAGLEQANVLRDIAERALAALPGLCLPGGVPLIGDISPDAPPFYFCRLAGLPATANAWPDVLSSDRKEKCEDLLSGRVAVSPDRLAEDGWHRFGHGAWQGLAFVSPDGWPPMPGHGHQDLGSFELHDGATPVIVDPGRGSYADSEYELAARHNGVTIDGREPAPANRPYYSDAFRRRILRQTPQMQRTRSGRRLSFSGMAHHGSIHRTEREWRFDDDSVEIVDLIDGQGEHYIVRRFIVLGDVTLSGTEARIANGDRMYRLSAETTPDIQAITRWSAYGEGRPASMISFGQTATLPFEGTAVLARD
jgi:hypothetical protein